MNPLNFDQSNRKITFRNIHKPTRKSVQPLVNSHNKSRSIIDRIHEDHALQQALKSLDFE